MTDHDKGCGSLEESANSVLNWLDTLTHDELFDSLRKSDNVIGYAVNPHLGINTYNQAEDERFKSADDVEETHVLPGEWESEK